MATRKSTTEKRTSKSSSTKKRASTSKKAGKAAGASRARKARRASSKKRAPRAGAESVALESVSLTGAACNACVRAVIGRVSGRAPKLDDKMSDLFVPCNAGVMRRLADAIRAECSNRNVTIVCGMTVRRVVNEYCG